ncbi:hypothetical protein [Deinococcus fonticola]|uniref:hypothetical protein n=1 Tax=Deinococcus fonticola TaxID=2528713 RepID=UPI0010753895|nr:hypothetical protein [Deinococcus fonticola]
MTTTTTKPKSNRPRCIIARDGVGYYRRRELDTHGLVGYRAMNGTRALLEMGQYRATLRSEHGELLGSFTINGTTCTVDCRPTAEPTGAKELEDVRPWCDWEPTAEQMRLSADAASTASVADAVEFRYGFCDGDVMAEIYEMIDWFRKQPVTQGEIARFA